MPPTLQQIVSSFLADEHKHGTLSDRIAQNYHFYLQRFTQWGTINSSDQITKQKVEQFRTHLAGIRNQRGQLMKPTTQNYHLIAIRAFLEYCHRNDIHALEPDAVTLNKTKRTKIQTPKKNDLERLLDTPLHTETAGVLQKRDKAILELLFTTGLKVSELSSLRKEHVLFFKDDLQIRGLGKTIRTVPLTNQAKYWVKQYLRERNDNQPALFIRHDKAKKNQPGETHLTPRTIQRIVKKYAKKAGLNPNITPESLRRSFAAALIEQGNDLKTVKKALGHASLTTTQYLYK